jgi:hypothetical protein
MKSGGVSLVNIESDYEKAISRSKLAVERNTRLLQVTMPIGVIRALARVRPLNARACARGSVAMLEHRTQAVLVEPGPRTFRRVELALLFAISCVFAAAVFVAMS